MIIEDPKLIIWTELFSVLFILVTSDRLGHITIVKYTLGFTIITKYNFRRKSISGIVYRYVRNAVQKFNQIDLNLSGNEICLALIKNCFGSNDIIIAISSYSFPHIFRDRLIPRKT